SGRTLRHGPGAGGRPPPIPRTQADPGPEVHSAEQGNEMDPAAPGGSAGDNRRAAPSGGRVDREHIPDLAGKGTEREGVTGETDCFGQGGRVAPGGAEERVHGQGAAPARD